MHQDAGTWTFAGQEQRAGIENVVVFTKNRGQVIDADLAAEIGISGMLRKRKLAFGATAPALDIGFGRPEPDALERCRDNILADGAIGSGHLAQSGDVPPLSAVTFLAPVTLALTLMGKPDTAA